MTLAALGDGVRARRDFEEALRLSDEVLQGWGSMHALSRAGIAELDNSSNSKQPTLTSPTINTLRAPGRRIALIIGNAKYEQAGVLENPIGDGHAIAGALRRLGFSEVIDVYDQTLIGMVAALKEFGDKSAGAEWAVVYYAGHGIEVDGVNYLIPVDAKLERDAHIVDEAIPLHRVLDKLEGAHELRLVILDACRNNPYLPKMARSATRGIIGKGLAMLEPSSGVLVAYSAKHGTTALDGLSGTFSPFADAVLQYIEEPGLELQFFFREVRDRVLLKTRNRQEPFIYGSLSREKLYFRPVLQ